MKKIFATLLLLFLVGCAQAPEPAEEQPNDIIIVYQYFDISVYRFVDKQAAVVCYVMDGMEKGGISCLPLDSISGNMR